MSPFIDLNDSDAHETQIGLKDLALLKSLWPYIKPHWKPLVGSAILLPLVSLTQVLQPFIIKQAIDGPIPEGDLHGLWVKVLMFFGLLIVHYGLRYSQMLLAQITGQNIILSLRTAFYNHLQSLSISFFHQTPLGKLVTRISSDVENISEVFSSGGIAIIADLAIIVGIIIAMFCMNLTLASVTIVMMPLVLLTMWFFRNRSREAYNAIRVQLAELNSTLQETLSGMDVIQTLRREAQNTQEFEGLSQKLMKTNLKSVIYDSSFTASIEFLSMSTIVLILGLILWQSQAWGHHGLTLGVIIAFLQYVQMLFEPIEEISDKFTIIQSGLASVEKIQDLMAIEPTLQSPPQALPLRHAKGHIQIQNLSFGYASNRPILQNLNLEIQPGEKVAIIGASGAGKSTIIKLINRQYDPQQGRILMDGVDIREYDIHALRRNIVVIPQEEFLFSRSIAENVALSPNIDFERLEAVAAHVHADTVINRLPQGYHTLLPERGRNLSNGERQLLVFARALWHDPAVIILDEATSSIDPQTEALVQDALEKSLQGRTAIIIAHRLSTIEQVDTVYVIDNGKIVESGPPETIFAQYKERQDSFYKTPS